jgi:DNA mismatch endonuclease (patch repair protein)
MKITSNAARDEANVAALLAAGWRVGIVWECALKGRARLDYSETIESCIRWINSDDKSFVLQGVEESAPGSAV